jgi:beta-ureidopropionase
MKSKSSISRRDFISKTAIGAGAIGVGAFNPQDSHAGENAAPNQSPREVVVISASHGRGHTMKEGVESMMKGLDVAISYNPDIICLPENFANDRSSAEEVPGPITNKYSEYAKKHNCYIICTLIRKENSKMFNSSVLIDRKGKIIGTYDKIHPTSGECKDGCLPASLEPPVFETDFGKIGIQICFDINWIDEWRKLKEKGAEIVFWPSTYIGGRLLTAHARLFNYYVVGCSRPGPSIIYNTAGDEIFRSGRHQNWAIAKLNLEKIHCEIDNHRSKARRMIKKYGRKVEVVYYHDEDWMTIESRSPDLTIQQLIDEYGFLPRWDYVNQETKIQKEYRG